MTWSSSSSHPSPFRILPHPDPRHPPSPLFISSSHSHPSCQPFLSSSSSSSSSSPPPPLLPPPPPPTPTRQNAHLSTTLHPVSPSSFSPSVQTPMQGIDGHTFTPPPPSIPTSVHQPTSSLPFTSDPLACSSTLTASSLPGLNPHPSHKIHPPPYINMPPPPVPGSRKRKFVDNHHHHQHQASNSSPPSSVSSSQSHDQTDSEYDPGVKPSRAMQRGGGGGASGSGSTAPKRAPKAVAPKLSGGRQLSREALRKANHSLIERRRREKINAALSELRSMVPGLGENGSGKGGEFKLEVLERTVLHMRELKNQLAELQARVRKTGPRDDNSMDVDDIKCVSPATPSPSVNTNTPHETSSSMVADPSGDLTTSSSISASFSGCGGSGSGFVGQDSPQTFSPDPNETEPETNLPPPLAVAGGSRSSASSRTASPQNPPSITSLLASAQAHRAAVPSARLPPPPSAANPTLYLPFPTPSPSSPFLSYGSSTISSSSTTSGPPEPSPFIAPLQNFSLFGGVLNLDAPVEKLSPQSLQNQRDMAPEEAANLLLAFSSPETLHPTRTGSTPLMSAVTPNGASIGSGPKRERRGTLDGEDFTLDGGVAITTTTSSSSVGGAAGVRIDKKSVGSVAPVPRTAREILRM